MYTLYTSPQMIYYAAMNLQRKKSQLVIIWLFRLSVLTALIAISIWIVSILKNPRLLPIDNVKIVAPYQHLDQNTLEQIITPYINNISILSLDVKGLKQALLQQPWIYSVLIKRIWPDQMEIDIVEQHAAAKWNDHALLNTAGEIFTPPAATFPPDLPLLQGPEGQQTIMFQKFQQYSQALTSLGVKIIELNLNQRQSWQMILDNKTIVILGRADIDQRFQRFVKAYSQIFTNQQQQAEKIDLRYPDGLAVEWKSSIPEKAQLPKINNLSNISF